MTTTRKSNQMVTGLKIVLAAGALLMSGIAAQAVDLVILNADSPKTLAAGSYTYGKVWLGNDGGASGPLVLNIGDGVTISCVEFINAFGCYGTVNQSGGSVTVTGTATGNNYPSVGNNLSLGCYGYNNPSGEYDLSGGTLTATAGITVFGADGDGRLTISGGTATLLGLMGDWNNNGHLVLSSGTLSLGAQGFKMNPGAYAGKRGTWYGTIIFSGGTLKLSNNGAIAVNFGTGTVDQLFLDGVQQVAGTWGKTGSGAANINDTYFSGGGVLTVKHGPGGSLILIY